jgi:hypothetical protein
MPVLAVSGFLGPTHGFGDFLIVLVGAIFDGHTTKEVFVIPLKAVNQSIKLHQANLYSTVGFPECDQIKDALDIEKIVMNKT